MLPHDTSIPPGLCQCGCGQPTALLKRARKDQAIPLAKGERARFVNGHSLKLDLRRPVAPTRCQNCGVLKEPAAFTGKAINTGERLWCNDCKRARQMAMNRAHTRRWRDANFDRYTKNHRRYRLDKFGLNPAEYTTLHEAQGGLCAICREPETRVTKGSQVPASLSIDHHHETGKVRGLLCWKCNVGIGNFRDRPDLLRRAAAYLKQHGG